MLSVLFGKYFSFCCLQPHLFSKYLKPSTCVYILSLLHKSFISLQRRATSVKWRESSCQLVARALFGTPEVSGSPVQVLRARSSLRFNSSSLIRDFFTPGTAGECDAHCSEEEMRTRIEDICVMCFIHGVIRMYVNSLGYGQ